MNSRSKSVIVCTGIVLALMWTFPPWVHYSRYKEDRHLGFRDFIINTGRGYFALFDQYHGEQTEESDRIVFEIDYPLLLAQTVVVALLAGTALVAFHGQRGRDTRA